MSGETPAQMSAADAANAIGQLVNTFKALRRGGELVEYLQGLDQTIVERNAELVKLGHSVAAADERLVQATARADEAERDALDRVRTAKDAADIAVSEARAAADRDQQKIWSDLRTKQDDHKRSLSEIDRQLAEKRAELDDMLAKVAAANADFAALRTRLGVG